jgi:hypothetical protein
MIHAGQEKWKIVKSAVKQKKKRKSSKSPNQTSSPSPIPQPSTNPGTSPGVSHTDTPVVVSTDEAPPDPSTVSENQFSDAEERLEERLSTTPTGRRDMRTC